MSSALSFSTLGFNLRVLDALLLAFGVWATIKLVRTLRSRAKTTKLPGPPASSWLFGVSKEVFSGDSGPLYEGWAKEYGPVFQVPGVLGLRRTVITDPKAITHFFSRQEFGYTHNAFGKRAIENLIGRGIIWSDGEDHRRQRKTMSPAFSNAAVRSLLPIFYDSAYKCKTAWDHMLAAANSEDGYAIINVQKWMNAISLDTIGLAGFGHDFGSLSGSTSTVAAAFDALGTAGTPAAGLSIILPLLAPVLPVLMKIPTKRRKLVKNLHSSMAAIADKLLERSRIEREKGVLGESGRSIIGALLRAEISESELRLSEDEVLAQMKVLILAGYETTSISLTWALIELARKPEKQDRLRAELSAFAAADPTYDQLTSTSTGFGSLPYLDSVFREVLRLHPPVRVNARVAATDDVLPLSTPVTTSSGEQVDRISIGKGVPVVVPIKSINTSEQIWGPDAKEFKPERWLDSESGLTPAAKDLGGFHHILSFIDGPRICLGRLFAVAEFKSVLTVLIRNYAFEMRDGPETKLDTIMTVLPRPKVVGEDGYAVPMKVRRVE